MNKNTNILTLILIMGITMFHVSLVSADTYAGNLYLTSQAEVDAFNYSEVTGSLKISGNDIVALDPLSVLTSIGGTLSMGVNPALTIVEDAFPGLTNVGGGIYFYSTSLVTFSGFDALLETGDNIDFWQNDSLTTVAGFGALHTVGWSLEFGENPVLTEMPAFENLQTIASSLFILDNASLTSIPGFNSLQYVDWSFQVLGNTALNDVCGFYDYCVNNDPYTGYGYFDINGNSPVLPSPTTGLDIMNAGPCGNPLEQQIEQLISDTEAMDFPEETESKLITSFDKSLRILEHWQSKDN